MPHNIVTGCGPRGPFSLQYAPPPNRCQGSLRCRKKPSTTNLMTLWPLSPTYCESSPIADTFLYNTSQPASTGWKLAGLYYVCRFCVVRGCVDRASCRRREYRCSRCGSLSSRRKADRQAWRQRASRSPCSCRSLLWRSG